jgi:hypothetical protein
MWLVCFIAGHQVAAEEDYHKHQGPSCE